MQGQRLSTALKNTIGERLPQLLDLKMRRSHARLPGSYPDDRSSTSRAPQYRLL
jgi:hypothetical protein